MELKNIQNFNLSSVNVTGVAAGYTNVLSTIDLGILSQSLEDLRNVSCTPQPGFYYKHFLKSYIRKKRKVICMDVRTLYFPNINIVHCLLLYLRIV